MYCHLVKQSGENAVYGKTIENLKKRIDVVKMKKTIWNGHQTQASKHKKIFDNDLVAIPKSKTT